MKKVCLLSKGSNELTNRRHGIVSTLDLAACDGRWTRKGWFGKLFPPPSLVTYYR